MFKKYKKGVVNRYKAGASGLEGEADELYEKMIHFSISPYDDIQWDLKEKAISQLENDINFQMVRTFFRNMFVPDEKEPLTDETKVAEESWETQKKYAMKPGFKKDLKDLDDAQQTLMWELIFA